MSSRTIKATLSRLRLKRLARAAVSPSCWMALPHRVAPPVEHLPALSNLKIDGILDVGANRGQFTLVCQLTHPKTPIVAFEPIPSEASTFRKVHGSRKHVVLIETALGDETGTATLHLSKSADCSSLFPIGKAQSELFENTGEIGTQVVTVQRLDDLSPKWNGRTQQLLKLDVQGYELQVLKGAVQTLKLCKYVYAECSDVSLYDGQALRHEVASFLARYGFKEVGCFNPLFNGDQLIQADYLFALT